jgi:hypothetical protein
VGVELIVQARDLLNQYLIELQQLESPEPLSTETNDTQDILDEPDIAWGAKVSPLFKERLIWIASALRVHPNYLMACMAWESGETFSPSIKNAAGSGATGLIQFMPSTARGLGTTTAQLAKMSAEDQLNYVYKYFRPYSGRLNNLGDVYMAILWPKGVGQPDHYVLFDRKKWPTGYRQNSGIDINKDGLVTRAECLVKVNEKLAKGLRTENIG